MISSKNLAEAIYQISKESKKDSDVIVGAILDYIKKYKLESILPKSIMYLEDKMEKDLRWNTFFIESRFNINEEILKKIKDRLNANEAKNLKLETNEEVIGGFIATYKGMIYDASIKNQLQLLKNSLIK